MRLRLLDEAEDDLRRGKAFYERQSHGLGAYFVQSLLLDLKSIRRIAGVHPLEHGYFRAISDRFPYKIYYVVEHQLATVVAILDSRQDPEKIRERLTRDAG